MPIVRRSSVPDEGWRTKSFASAPQERRAKMRRRTPEPERATKTKKPPRRHPRLEAIRAATEEYRGHPRTKEDKHRARDAILLIAEARKGGRPPDYNELFCEFVFKLMLLGITKDDLANQLEVNRLTLDNWCNEHPEFLSAITRGGTFADANVAVGTYKSATGFEREGVKIFLGPGGDPVYAPYTEYFPPNPTAGKMWLTNRQPDLWRDRRELTGKDGSPLLPDPKHMRMADLLEAMVLIAPDVDLDEAKTVEGVFEIVE
jgi:hypothetical protein